MSEEIKALIHRNAPTMAFDAFGLAALVVMLMIGLHAPGFF